MNKKLKPAGARYAVMVTVAIAVALSSGATAQQNNLGDEQINVVKAYQPTLSDAFKISDTPTRDTAVTYVPDMKYEVSQIMYPTVYTISPIKPLRIKDENIKKLYRGFIKGGYGTKNTPYAEVFYNSLRSKEFDAGVHLNYFSSTGDIDGYGHPDMKEAGAGVYGTRFFDQTILRGELRYDRSIYHYYGYSKPPDILSKSDTRHSFDDFTGDFSFRSSDTDKDALRYKASFLFNSFSDNRENDEGSFTGGAELGKDFNGLDVNGVILLDFLKYANKSYGSDNRTIVRINPRFVKSIDNVKITAGANIPVEVNDLTKYHFYPHIRADITLAQDVMTIYAQATGDLERKSFRSFSNENPFIGMDLTLRNTNRKLDVSAGMYVKLDRQLAFNGSISLARFTDDTFYRNLPPSTSTPVVYDVIYDDNTATTIHAEIIYDQGDKTGWSLIAEYNANNPSAYEHAVFRPEFTMALDGRYLIGEKIYLHTLWQYISSRNAFAYTGTQQTGYTDLKGYLDVQLGVDYRYSKVLSVFLDFNNITASKYSRWYNYPSYRFGIIGGLTYAF
jgi:hypothetical protein